MKNLDYNTVLMFISLFLAFAIFFSLLFGCSYRRYNRRSFRERFETSETSKTSSETSDKTSEASKKSADTSEASDEASENVKPYDAKLDNKERKLKDDIRNGKLNENDLVQMFNDNKVDEKNIKKIIESFENEIQYNTNKNKSTASN